MRLRLLTLTELRFGKASRRVRDLLAVLSPRKRQHSLRVGRTLHKAGVKKAGVYAGLLHDVVEGGLDFQELLRHMTANNLPPKAIEIVKALSSDEKNSEAHPNEPLAHLMRVLPAIQDEDLRNVIVLTKMADRIDNIYQRVRTKGLRPKYAQKSEELVDFLRSNYTGPWRPMGKLLTKYYQLIRPSSGA